MARSPTDYTPLHETHAQVSEAQKQEAPDRTPEMEQRLMTRPQPQSAQLQARLIDQGMDNQQTVLHEVGRDNNSRLAATHGQDRDAHQRGDQQLTAEGRGSRPDYSQLQQAEQGQSPDKAALLQRALENMRAIDARQQQEQSIEQERGNIER